MISDNSNNTRINRNVKHTSIFVRFELLLAEVRAREMTIASHTEPWASLDLIHLNSVVRESPLKWHRLSWCFEVRLYDYYYYCDYHELAKSCLLAQWAKLVQPEDLHADCPLDYLSSVGTNFRDLQEVMKMKQTLQWDWYFAFELDLLQLLRQSCYY